MRTILFSTLAVLAALISPLAASAADSPPNIVLLLTDDHPWDEYGFMGSERAITPNIDRLAEQSLRFPNGYVTSPVCRPSLGTILTGRYPHETGIVFNRSPQDDENNAAHLVRDWPTLPQLLKRAGYASIQTGKHWEGGYANAGFDEGTTLQGGWNGVVRNGKKIGRETLEPIFDFVDQHSAEGTPVFVWYGVYLPHAPTDAPEQYRAPYRDQGLEEHEIAYLANITWLDDSIGELIGYFEKKGMAENTLFFLISDNGMTIDPDPWWGGAGGKTSIAELGIRTPFLIRWDGEVEPGEYEAPVSSVDVVPTLVEAAGVDAADADLPGVDLIDLARAGEPEEPRPVFGENYNPNITVIGTPEETVSYRWVRLGDYKLMSPENLDRRDELHANWPQAEKKTPDHFDEVRLHDLSKDPGEETNLADDPAYAEKRDEMLRLLDQWWPLEG